MFKNPEEFSCVVIERKNKFPELELLEIIVQLQDEYELEDNEIMKLIDPYLISMIEAEAMKNKQLKSKLKSMF